MTRIASIDGALVAPEHATISIYDRGFLYGDSVFETLRTYGGEPYALDEHLARLARSAADVAIAMPIDRASLAMEVRRAVRAAQSRAPASDTPLESYIRVMLTRGEAPLGLDPTHALSPRRVILIEPLTPPPASLYRDGIHAVTARVPRTSDAKPSAKVGNYLASLLALQRARALGAAEVLVLDADGHVTEGTTSNVFLVRDRALITPPEHAGILAGITRAHVLECARDLGLEITLAPITPADLSSATEAFLTSSLRELLPLTRIDDIVIAHGRPGPITRTLHEAFRRNAGLAAQPMPWQ